MPNDVNPECLKPYKSDEFLPPIGTWTRLGGWFLVGTAGMAIALAAAIEYKVAVKAAGTVRPWDEIEALHTRNRGVVTRILVRENQSVQPGDAIAIVDISGNGDRPQRQTEIIRTAIRGRILKLNMSHVRQIVESGEEIAHIVPDGAPPIVKARVATRDIGQVRVCQLQQVERCQVGKAQLRVAAYPYPEYGVLKAAVVAIAPDATRQDDAYFYEVTLRVERPYFLKGNARYPIQPGMEVTAEIFSREETLLAFILRKARLLADI